MQKKHIEQVMKDHQDSLLALPGVQGFYQSAAEDGSDIIVIMVDTLTEEKKKALPDSLDGYPVKHEETGIIRPLN